MGKWKLYVPILLIFACLTGLLVFDYGLTHEMGQLPSDLEFQDKKNSITLSPFYDETEDAYFLFLPACTSLSDVTVSNAATGRSIPFSLVDLGPDADNPSGKAVEVTLSRTTYTIPIWQCDSLPSIFLQGKSNMLEHVHQDKQNKASSYITILDETGEVLLQELGTLSGRGNGTWGGSMGTGQPKRPYNLGFSKPISVGPFEEVTTLCLLAEYSDESKLRNSLVYYAGQELGLNYASPYTYVNLFVNGEYLGLYGVVTKQNYVRHIQEDQIADVFECTSYYGTHDFYSRVLWQPMKLFYGDAQHGEDIVTCLEEALTQQDWARCEQLMDVDSFARMYALQEFFCNIDMTYASQYFYVDYDEVIHTMLPWDFDFSMGSAINHFNPSQERSLLVYRNDDNFSWYLRLLEWEEFRQRVADVIQEDYTDAFFQKLSQRLLGDIERIETSRACENRRWKNAPDYIEFYIASGMETLEEFHDFYTGFFPKRRDFMLEYFRNAGDYCRVSLYSETLGWCSCVMIPKGSRPADYIDEEAFVQRVLHDIPSKGLFTEDGVPLADIGPVFGNLALTARIQ